MKKRVRLAVLGIVAVAVVAAAVLYALAPLAVEAEALEPQTARLTFTETGSYTYSGEYKVFSLLSGEVLEVYVREGDRVSKGDPIALLSATDYESQIQQLESSIKGYNAQIANLGLTEQQEKAELSAAREELMGHLRTLESEMEAQQNQEESLEKQMEHLMDAASANASLSRSLRRERRELKSWNMEDTVEYYTVDQAYASAQSALANTYAQLEQLRAGALPDGYFEGQRLALQAQIDAIDARLGKSYTGAMAGYYNAQIESARAGIDQMNEMLGKAVIYAPADGVVRDLPLAEANLAAGQAPCAVLGQDPAVEAYISTRYVDEVAVGDTVELVVEKQTGDQVVAGRVVEIATRAETRLSALGLEEQKVKIRILPDDPLLMGSGVDVRFTTYQREDSLVVPKTAVFSLEGADHVWLVVEGALALQPVEVGVELREGYVVEGGLNPGDMVITDANREGLREGRAAKAG